MPSSGKTILIVDDDEALRTIAVKLVERRGYATRTAADGHEALEILKSGAQFDMLILDVVMPGMDGFETLKEVRSLGYNDFPVVMLTAQSGDQDVLRGYEKGADCYLTKPLKPAELVNIVDYLIGDLSPEEKAKLEPLL